jgi:(R,R)-butanediol dehydrogenase / meso-butanediol dehydrogenase / diacetyl reductase
MSEPVELPGSMPAAVYRKPGTVSVEEYPVPPLGTDEVLIEVSHCGICGSDLHFVLEGWSAPDIVHGHEFSGRIAAVGSGVETWPVGTEVVGGPSPRCGTCPACRAGLPSQCERRGEVVGDSQGAFARYIAVDQRSLLAVPDGMSLRAAALAEPLAVSLHGITRSGIVPGERALVLGAGPIGALIVAALVARGYTDVAVAEPGPARQELARRLGADPVLSPDELPVFTVAEPDRIAPDAYHVVFECSGKRAAMESGLSQLRRGGRLVLVGAGIEPPRFDPNRILLNELTITGSFVYDADGFQVALDLLASGRIPVDVLVEPDDVPLDGIVDAMQELASGRTAGKVMVVPRHQKERA